MATKKKAANPANKMLVTAMKKTINNNPVLPILEDVLFFPDMAIVCDLENFVTIPYVMKGIPESGICVPAKMFEQVLGIADTLAAKVTKDHGITFIDGDREMKLMGEDPLNYPKSPEGPWEPLGTLEAEQVADIATALLFVSNDYLRPAMTGIYFNKDIAATDAHRLFWKKITPMKREFILPAKSAKIMLALGGNKWEVFGREKEGDSLQEAGYIRLVNEYGVEILARAIDARYPNYNQVIPDIKEVAGKIVACPSMIMKEITNASKFANRSTNMVVFELTDKVKISSQDVDFSFEYKSTIKGADVHFKEGVEKNMTTAFNAKFLMQIIAMTPPDSPVEIDLWGPTKAAIINKSFLVMPVMLNY